MIVMEVGLFDLLNNEMQDYHKHKQTMIGMLFATPLVIILFVGALFYAQVKGIMQNETIIEGAINHPDINVRV